MESNLKVRAFWKCNIYRTFRKQALGFVRSFKPDYREELYVLPFDKEDGSEPGVFLRGGDAHLRGAVKEAFKKDLGTETPTFAQAFEFYSPLGPTIKDKVYKYCCG